MRNMMFRVQDYVQDGECFHFARKSLTDAPPAIHHNHDYYECFWIEEGRLRHWIGDRTETLSRGDLVFIRPQDRHAVQRLGGDDCRIVNISFPRESVEFLGRRYAEDIQGRWFWRKGDAPEVAHIDPEGLARLTELSNALEQGPRRLSRAEAFILELTTGILHHENQLTDRAPSWLERACAAAQKPAVFRDGAAGFVRVAGRTHEHVSRTAQLHLGCSPSVYINRIRMKHAARKLASADDSPGDIAYECGLENLSHFYRLFRREFGMTPIQYRKRHHADPVQPDRTRAPAE